MSAVRRVVRVGAALWVCCHLGGVVASPAVLCLGASRESAVECTCGHGDHATCPTHHSKPSKPRSPSDCSCRNASDPIAVVLVAIVGPTAVLPQRFVLDTPRAAVVLDHALAPQPQSPVLTRDGPPPRS